MTGGNRVTVNAVLAAFCAAIVPAVLTAQPPTVERESVVAIERGAMPLWMPATQRLFTLAREKSRWALREATRTLFDDGEAVSPLVASADGRHAAFAVKRPSGTSLFIDGEDQGQIPYDKGKLAFASDPLPVVLSSDGRHAAYAIAGEGKSAERGIRVISPGGGFEFASTGVSIAEFAISSGRSPRLALVAQFVDRWAVIVDGKEIDVMSSALVRQLRPDGPPFRALAFSADGQRLAYKAAQGVEPPDRRASLVTAPGVVLDGRVHSPSTAVGPVVDALPSAIAFSEEGDHIAYLMRRHDGTAALVLDTIVRPVSDFTRVWGGPVFSRNGQHVAWIIERQDRVGEVVIDGTTIVPLEFAFDIFLNLVVSNDGRHTACALISSGFSSYTRLFLDGRQIAKDERRVFANSLEFLPDGRLTYLAVADSKVERVRLSFP